MRFHYILIPLVYNIKIKQNKWRLNMVSDCNAFFNVIQRLRIKTLTLFDHDETYKLGHGPRTNTNHVHIFRPCKKHLQSLN